MALPREWAGEVTTLARRLAQVTSTGGLRRGYFIRAAPAALRVLGIMQDLTVAHGRGGLFGDRPETAALSNSPEFDSLVPISRIVRDAVKFIHSHYDKRVGTAEVASAVGVSEAHLRRLFTQQVGKAPLAYRDLLRVRHMARLLAANDDVSVGVAARAVGWGKASRAAAVFKQETAMTPTAFRDKFGHGKSAVGVNPDPLKFGPETRVSGT